LIGRAFPTLVETLTANLSLRFATPLVVFTGSRLTSRCVDKSPDRRSCNAAYRSGDGTRTAFEQA